jgi:hypothetical protein
MTPTTTVDSPWLPTVNLTSTAGRPIDDEFGRSSFNAEVPFTERHFSRRHEPTDTD